MKARLLIAPGVLAIIFLAAAAVSSAGASAPVSAGASSYAPQTTPTVEPEFAILQYVKDYYYPSCTGPLGTPGHRRLEFCYPYGYYSHPTNAFVDNYDTPAGAQAAWQARRDSAQATYPIFGLRSYGSNPGYYAGNENYPYAHHEDYFWGSRWVMGAVSSDDTHFRGSPLVAGAIYQAAVNLGYLPPSGGTITPTPTATPQVTPTPCGPSYNYTVSTSTIVSGTTLLPGSQCGVCTIGVTLPFPFTFYGQTYTSANLSTQGTLQFATSYTGFQTCELPEPPLGPAMLAHWGTLETAFHTPCEQYIGSPCGIYTSVSGSAPNRIFNVHWRARFMGTSQHTANFVVRLYENSGYFEYVYGWVSYGGGHGTIAVQDGVCRYTMFSCDVFNVIQPGTRIGWGGSSGGTPTPTNTVSISPTPHVDGADFVGEMGWAPSCDAPRLRLTTRNIGLPGTGAASTMRVTNSAGDYREFAVPCCAYPYSVECELGTCIPTSWLGDMPFTLVVDYYNTVQETNETNNTSTINYPPPLPTPCITPTYTSTRVPGATNTPTATRTSTATRTPCAVSFSDVPENHTFYQFVRCLACREILGGYADGTFRPDNLITRGQLAKIVSNTAGYSEPPSGWTFQDAPPDSTFYAYVQRMSARGHMTGYACGGVGEPCVPPENRPYFRPSTGATRGQIAKVVDRVAGFAEPVTGQAFEDVPETHTFYVDIGRLANRGIIGGYTCGGAGEPCVPPESRPYFRPGNPATRGQIAKVVANTFFPGCQTQARW